MIRQIKSKLSSGDVVYLKIKKKTQIYGSTISFLTSRHKRCAYPIVEDTSLHLDNTNEINVLETIDNSTNPNWKFVPAFKCETKGGTEFYLFQKDAKRFTTF